MGSYVTVSTKVRREVVEKARMLGISISEFLRMKLEEEVKRRELELIKQKLDSLGDVLEAVDVERIVRHVREDREAR
ncbi:MAG: type II toxin-antitoxin system CcdA family antitoxin [Acidilobaceae archaeon]